MQTHLRPNEDDSDPNFRQIALMPPVSSPPQAPERSPRPFPGGRPKGIRAPHGARVFEINWATPDGPVQHRLPHAILRGYCPCAGCQGHGGSVRFIPPPSEDLRELQPVGNYALSLVWGDHHSTGIYSFAFLWKLGELMDCLGEEGLKGLGELPR